MSDPAIYIVDDDPGVQAAIRRLLRPLGCPVRAFLSAEAFLAASGPDARGCLLLDVGLPGMSGMELQQHLLSEGWELPIVFFTSRLDPAMRETAMRRGAVAFLHKPSGLDQLRADVAAALAAGPTPCPSAAARGTGSPPASA